MKKARFSIRGTKPMLYHKFNIECVTNTKKPKDGTTGNNPNEWKETVWTEGKRLFIPNTYMHSAISAGGKHVKVGRGTISKNVCSALTILDEKIYYNRELPKLIEDLTIEELGTDSSRPIYVDIRAVCNPQTKGKNIRYRLAQAAGWELTTNIEWDDTILSQSQMRDCIERLGKLVGLSDARTLGYGRFEILDFSIV